MFRVMAVLLAGSTPNMLRYITTCRAGAQVLARLRRRSY
jgi:hypothetical protein